MSFVDSRFDGFDYFDREKDIVKVARFIESLQLSADKLEEHKTDESQLTLFSLEPFVTRQVIGE